jgi:iron complex transport system substrate-binding protein
VIVYRESMLVRQGLALLAGSCLLLGAWSAEAANVTDMLGRHIPVPDRPLRLVSLAPSLTETVYALGRGDWLVGVTDICDYPAEARAKPKVGGIAAPSLERIVSLSPDLVLTTAEGNSRNTLEQLERLGIVTFALKPDSYAGVIESMRALGRLLGAEPVARQVVGEIQERVRAVRSAVIGRPRPRVLYLIWTEPLIAAGPATYIHGLLDLAGGENIVQGRTVPYPRLDWEQVIGGAPDIILVADHRADAGRTAPAAASTPREWKGWEAVPAIRSGRVVPIPSDTVLRPGPRVGEGLTRLAEAIHRDPGERQGAR